MGMFAAGAAALLGGGLLSAASASNAAKAQNKAAEDARNFYDDQTLVGMARQALALYGGQQGMEFLRSALPRESYDKLFGRASSTNYTESDRARMQAIDDRIAQIEQSGQVGWQSRSGQRGANNSNNAELARLQQEKQYLTTKSQGDPGVTALLDPQAYASNQQGYLQKLNDLAGQYEGKGNQLLSGYRADTQRLLEGSRQIERGAANFGAQERTRINRESDQALTNANRAALARLSASGLGDSTLVGNQYGANATNINNMRQDQLGALGDRQINMLTGLRQNTLGLDQSRSMYGTQLGLSLNDQSLALRQQPLQTEIGVLTGNAFNPYLGQNTTQYFPGASGSAAAGATFGNALGAMGGQLMGYGLSSNQATRTPQGQNGMDWSYSAGSTQYGSNRPR